MAHLPEGLGQPTRISYSKEPRLPVDVAQVIINYNTTQNINSVQCCNVLVCFPIYQSRVYPIKHTTQKARSDKFNCQIPCPANYEQQAVADLRTQADQVVKNLKVGSIETQSDKEIIAMIAYLQRLGVDIKSAPTNTPANTAQAAQADSTSEKKN